MMAMTGTETGGWWVWALAGGVMTLGGVLALANPLAATLTAEQIAAWVVLLAGVLQLIECFRSRSWSVGLLAGILAAAYLWLGVSLLFDPLAGVVTLTAVVAAGFLVSGVVKLAYAVRMRRLAAFWPFLLSAVLSILLAVMVFFNFPVAAAMLLGTMLAVELVASGATMIAFAVLLRRPRPL